MIPRDPSWPREEVRSFPLESFDDRLQRYRLANPSEERALAQSMQRYGQLSPLVVSLEEQSLIVVDGFKRLRAARKEKGLERLQARWIEVDEQGAKAAIYNLNLGRPPVELEEAWIVHALVREDGLSQVEVGTLLGRHKSWVNRRLAMIERLCEEAKAELRMGLLTPGVARQLTRLPRGNQVSALRAAREASLTSRELADVVDLLLGSCTREQTDFVLKDPRRALAQAKVVYVHRWDPRLSTAGNRAAKHLGSLLDGLAKMRSWLLYRARPDLHTGDREVLDEAIQQLISECREVTAAAEEFLVELKYEPRAGQRDRASSPDGSIDSRDCKRSGDQPRGGDPSDSAPASDP